MEKTLTWGSLESPMRNMVASLSGLSSFWLEPHVRLIASRRATWRGSLVTTNKKSTFWSGNCGDKIVEFSAGKMYRLTSRGVSWSPSWRRRSWRWPALRILKCSTAGCWQNLSTLSTFSKKPFLRCPSLETKDEKLTLKWLVFRRRLDRANCCDGRKFCI